MSCSRLARSAVVALLAWACTGGSCNSTIRPPPDQVTEADELLRRMVARLDELQSARLRVVSEYYGGDLRGANFRQVVLVRQPEDIHIQILSPFGQSLQTLVSNGTTLSLYDLESEVYYYGAPSPENLARMIPFYMTAGDIVRVLLGGPPLDLFDPDPHTYLLSWDGDQGRYRLVVPLAWDPGHLELGVGHGDWTIQSALCVSEDGETVFELRTGDLETIDGMVVPTRLRFLLEGEHPVDMSIEVESAEVNPALPDSLFVLEAPVGVEQVPLD